MWMISKEHVLAVSFSALQSTTGPTTAQHRVLDVGFATLKAVLLMLSPAIATAFLLLFETQQAILPLREEALLQKKMLLLLLEKPICVPSPSLHLLTVQHVRSLRKISKNRTPHSSL